MSLRERHPKAIGIIKTNRSIAEELNSPAFFIEVIVIFLYPENLKSKAALWLWELRDIGIIGAGLLLSVLALVHLNMIPLLVITCLYAFLTIRIEESSIMDFLRYAANFLFLKQQHYEWRERNE